MIFNFEAVSNQMKTDRVCDNAELFGRIASEGQQKNKFYKRIKTHHILLCGVV